MKKRAGSVSSVPGYVSLKLGFKPCCLILEQVVGAQFPIKLEKYAEDLITLKNDFQIAMVMQIAVDAGKIGMCSLFQTCPLLILR